MTSGATNYAERFESPGSSTTSSRGSLNGAIDLDAARSERTSFPAPFRSTSSSLRPAVPSRSGSPELIGLVDRYREATSAAYARSDRTSVAPILDRYSRSSRSTRDAAAIANDSAVERYGRGPIGRRTSSASALTPRASRGSSAAPARTSERSSRAASSRSESAEPTRARKLSALAARSPETARRILNAGGAVSRATALGLAAGTAVTGGPVAGALVRSAYDGPRVGKGYESGLYFGYGYYPWSGFGYGSSSGWWFGFGWDWCWPSYGWSPYWTCTWYPYYCYSYYYCHPYYSSPSYYYPWHYSTVVHHVYEDDDDDEVVIIIQDDDDQVAYVDEPVGEAVAGSRPVDSPLKLSLSIASERYLTLGDQAFRDGRFTDAAQFYAKAVEYSPDEGVMHLVLADALFATGDYHYAAYAIRRALELDPSLADAVVDKHAFYSDPAEFDRHIAAAELFVNANPADGDARLVLAANYLFGNRPAAAVDLLEHASAASLRVDSAATILLSSARAVQYGKPTAPARND